MGRVDFIEGEGKSSLFDLGGCVGIVGDSMGIFDRVIDREDWVGVIDKLERESLDKSDDVAMGEDIGKDVRVGIGGFVGRIDIGVAWIDKDVGIFGICGDVGSVITDGVDLMGMGNAANVEVERTDCFINVSRGNNDMFAKEVDVEGVIEIDVGEEIGVRDVGICVDMSGDETDAKESNVVDWGVFEVAKVDGIVEFDVDVIRIGEGVSSR
ncbi:hypothetical protein KI387_044035 [Taxus chinensis]|uniref:Uncharacterized protein n=1 Tax=Taxus chinensis TaxID=29808 RepID=A0AA38L6G3_TAXCH|nr:hypothetical protein KI387_044035 [Taxus chinensis]